MEKIRNTGNTKSESSKVRSGHQVDLTQGNITKSLWAFAIPLMFGNILQQLYNLVDTWVVGRYIGDQALAAVGSSYTLMTFLTSIVIGLCLGSGTFISMAWGRQDIRTLRNGIYLSFVSIGLLTVGVMLIFYLFLSPIISVLQVPQDTFGAMYEYLFYVFFGFFATFLYNYTANILRGIGNSVTPLSFLAVSVILNIFLDLYFVLGLHMGIRGAALATVAAQTAAGGGIFLYAWMKYPIFRLKKEDIYWDKSNFKRMLSLSGFTCLQQSVMNFGILMVQGIVNSFGASVMAAFAVAVKIDTIAYMPVQDFGNAFSVFVAQNFGAQKPERIRIGVRKALISVVVFCVIISAVVCLFARPLMQVFVDPESAGIVRIGVQYLRIEGAFYIGIGILFLLYGYYRAIDRPLMSVVLTVISLGTRVVLAYVLSAVPEIAYTGIWAAIPIGWFLADLSGLLCMKKRLRSV